MNILSPFKYSALLTPLFFLSNCTQTKNTATRKNNLEQVYYTAEDFKTVEKIDAHVHVNTNKPDYLQQAADENFRW